MIDSSTCCGLPERWRPASIAPERYEVSDHGRVWSNYSDRPLAGTVGHGGYIYVVIYRGNGNGSTSQRVHALVAHAFIGPAPRPDLLVCHDNGDPTDNHLDNLRWDTVSANWLDAVRHGTHPQTRKTHCPLGHPLAAPNLDTTQLKHGRRSCAACSQARHFINRRRRAGRAGPELHVEAAARFDRLMRTAP